MAAVRFPQWTKAIFLRQNKSIMFFFLFLYVLMSFISAVFFFSLLPVSDKSKQTFLYFSASCNLFFFFFFFFFFYTGLPPNLTYKQIVNSEISK